jgi:regulator of cell morphogenesis and NO signaling
MNTIDRNRTVGSVVAEIPQAAELFMEYKIDFCCGGDRPLAEVLEESGIDEEEILTRLEEIQRAQPPSAESTDFRKMTPLELIDYIENTHHVYVKKTLPELGDLSTTVLRAHGSNHEELFRVHKLFNNLKTELEEHLIKEEVMLFPKIRAQQTGPAADGAGIRERMAETVEEHETAGAVLKELREITGDYTVPADGCPTYRLTYEKLEELEADLFRHIHLENNLLFPKV